VTDAELEQKDAALAEASRNAAKRPRKADEDE
jgi:hypothetical protein